MRCDLAHMKCLMQGVIAGAKKVDVWPADPNGSFMSHKKKFTTENDVAAAMEVDDEVDDTIVNDIQVEGV